MPNLVGIGNEQVPTNAMLGGLAYQDPAHTNLIEAEIENIAAIKAKIRREPEGLFVYNTANDSDGGAWRYRCQDKSWYNEPLGTRIRGHRREFPSIAVIYCDGDYTYIHDGDDPNMPMWMVLPTITGQQNMIAGFNDHDLISVTALNGIIVVGTSPSWNHGNIIKVNFIKDDAVAIAHNNDKKWTGGIANRNSDDYWQTIGSGHYIVTNHVNDVAMGVLPNAPIDPETGLPIPTIAVACEGGITVFREDGSANDIVATSSGYVPVGEVQIHGNRLYSLSSPRLLYTFPLPWTSSTTGGSFAGYNGLVWMSSLQAEESDYSQCHILVKKNGDLAIATPTELLLNSPNYSHTNVLEHASGRLTASIGTDYNSGWMVGNVIGAWLADTDDTNISADTLQAESHSTLDSTFATSNGWSHGSSWSISGGVATCDGGSDKFLYPNANTFPIGTIVAVEVTVTAYTSGTLNISFDTGNADSATAMTATGTYYHVGECTGNQIVYLRSASFVGSVDNVKMYIAEADRCKGNTGLAVVGTITKSPVASGSELVSYSGNGTSNYLIQPYNSDLDFGTDSEYTVMGWLYTTNVGGGQYIFDRSVTYNSSRNFQSWIAADLRYITFYVGGGQTLHSGNYAFNNNVWFHFCFTRRKGNMWLHINGIEIKTSASTVTTVPASNQPLKILYNMNSATKMALFRISATSITTDQIKKIYREELPLFQEDAKCTLYGSSNDIKAIGYDDSNDILHVGTSSGRSEMNGLKLINNTTTAVTNAISASNGLVAEQ